MHQTKVLSFFPIDNKSLAKCRMVDKSWRAYLDNQKILQIRIIQATVKDFHKIGDTWKRVFETATTKTIMYNN